MDTSKQFSQACAQIALRLSRAREDVQARDFARIRSDIKRQVDLAEQALIAAEMMRASDGEQAWALLTRTAIELGGLEASIALAWKSPKAIAGRAGSVGRVKAMGARREKVADAFIQSATKLRHKLRQGDALDLLDEHLVATGLAGGAHSRTTLFKVRPDVRNFIQTLPKRAKRS